MPDDFVQLTEKQSVCPECGDEFASLAHHWDYNPGHRPEIDVLQEAVCAGLVLGGCKIDTNNQTPALDVRTQRLGFAVWINEHLGWLANAIHKSEPSRQSLPMYVVRSVAHPRLEMFARWRSGDDRPGPQRTIETMLTIRAWVAKKAGVGWSGESASRRTRFYAEDEVRRAWYRENLEYLGYEPYENSARLQINQAETRSLLDSIGPPVPGQEHKWAIDKEEYEALRSEQRAWLQRMSLKEFQEQELGSRPRAWSRKYSEPEVLRFLRWHASDGELTIRQYKSISSGRDVPSVDWLKKNSYWNTWLKLAGLQTQSKGGWGR